MKKNLYELLGLDSNATEKEVRDRYKIASSSTYNDSNEWRQISAEMNDFFANGKEVYDAKINSFDKENDYLFSMVNGKKQDTIYSNLGVEEKSYPELRVYSSNEEPKKVNVNKGSFDLIKNFSIKRTNKKARIKDTSNFKRKIKNILVGVAALVFFIAGTATYINNSNDEKLLDDPTTSVSEFYTDADVKMETIEYLVENGSNTSTVADIANELGISLDQCIKVGNIKVSPEGVIFTVSVPEDVAKKYKEEKEEKDRLTVKKHYLCEYKTPDEFRSLVEVAQEIVSNENFSGFSEGKEYTKDGRTPANQLAKDMIRDNPNMGKDLQHAESGDYILYFYGTDEEYENFVKEGKLTPEVIKIIN